MADESGNCGTSDSGYRKCKPKYVLQNISEEVYCLKFENTTRWVYV